MKVLGLTGTSNGVTFVIPTMDQKYHATKEQKRILRSGVKVKRALSMFRWEKLNGMVTGLATLTMNVKNVVSV